MVQIAAIAAAVVIVAIIAWAWTRKKGGSPEASSPGIPVEAFGHVVEEQARQTEALRTAVEGLAEIVHEMRKLLETRTFCPFPAPRCGDQPSA